MMQVTPMWMPMTMPVVDVWLVASSFRQSHGGLRAGGGSSGRLGAVASRHPALEGYFSLGCSTYDLPLLMGPQPNL